MEGEQEESVRIPEAALKGFCVLVLQRIDVPEDDAVLIVDNLVEATLRGLATP